MSKSNFSNSSLGRLEHFFWLSNPHHVVASSLKFCTIHHFQLLFHNHFYFFMYYSIVVPLSFPVNNRTLLEAMKRVLKRTLTWRKVEIVTISSILLRILIMTCFQKWNNHSASTHVVEILIQALEFQICVATLPP